MRAETELDLGLIVPPPEVRAVLNKTARYVGKHGTAFEEKIRAQNPGSTKYSFIEKDSPYYAFYQKKIEEERANAKKREEEDEQRKEEASKRKHDEQSRNRAPDPTGEGDLSAVKTFNSDIERMEVEPVISHVKAKQARAQSQRVVPDKPPPSDVYTVDVGQRPPPAFELEVIKLTAQFAARHGRSFTNTLVRKENRNPLFDFLRPVNRHFGVFQAFIESYENVMNSKRSSEETVQLLRKKGESKALLLADIMYEYDWDLIQEQSKDEEEDSETGAKAALIDWHDFVVLETIDLDDHEPNLPAPVADPHQIPKVMEAAENARREYEQSHADVDMDIDTEDVAVVAADVHADIPADRVRKEVVPVVIPRSVAPGAQNVVLPSGQEVPLAQADKSVRAELRDPKYKEERARAAEKNRLVNLASGDEIARNVAAMNYSKTEVFNHVDLHRALASQDRPLPPEVKNPMKPVPAGPQLPATRKAPSSDADLAPPEKKARVQAAVGLLSAASLGPKVESIALDPGAASAIPSGLISEEEWLKKSGTSVQITIKFPRHPNKDWKLSGQSAKLEIPLKKTVKQLKATLTTLTKVPINKQKLLYAPLGFLKDKLNLAYYNVPNGAVLAFEVKERGGKKR